MHHTKSLPLLLIAILPFGVLAPACTSGSTSSLGQTITCSTDPGTGVVLRCAPGDDSGDHTCTDVDEDGGGGLKDLPPPMGRVGGAADDGGDDSGANDDDDDDDGIPDDEDCDHHPGEDHCDGDDGSEAKLPYDVQLELGATVRPIIDAFAAEGAQPASIDAVTLDGGAWRLAELVAGTPFVVTADDCAHQGNRDVGRDRVVVSWTNADGTTHADHLDLRYCKP